MQRDEALLATSLSKHAMLCYAMLCYSDRVFLVEPPQAAGLNSG